MSFVGSYYLHQELKKIDRSGTDTHVMLKNGKELHLQYCRYADGVLIGTSIKSKVHWTIPLLSISAVGS